MTISINEKQLRWAQIEAGIKAEGPEMFDLEWGRLREQFYADIGGFMELPEHDSLRLKELKNRYQGERIFILGNGPSINQTPLHLLEGEYTFGVNRCYLLYDRIKWKPTFYTALDWRVVPDVAREINGLTGSIFFFEERFRGLLREGSDTYYYTHTPAPPGSKEERHFSLDISQGVRGAGSVVGTAIQLAYFMGFDPIYLIGCDLGYKVPETVAQEGEDKFGTGVKIHLTSTRDDDANHFDPRYFGKGRRWHDPNVKRMIQGHEQCRAAIEKQSRRIYNATVGGELEVYERRNFLELFTDRLSVDRPRSDRATVDETQVVAHLFRERRGAQHLMLDIGAHSGSSASFFHVLDWRIYCFEPDPTNRSRLEKRFAGAANVNIDPRAVSDRPASGVPFFTSGESSGISGLSAFRATHKESARVDVTTVADIIRDRGISHVDFLKIDVEGFDFCVLKGVPWDRLKPDVVECEFEDAKTVPLGHTWKDIADFLRGQGYHVYVSEWHPIVRYGIPHDWRRVYKYPGPPMDSSAWGNFLAFREDPGMAAVQAAFEACMKFRPPKEAGPPTKAPQQSDKNLSSSAAAESAKPAVKSGISAGAATNVNPPAPRTAPAGREQQTRDGRVNMLQKTPPNLLETPPPAGRMWYSAPAHRLRQVSPQLFTLLQFARRSFVHVISRPHLLIPLIAAAGLAAWVCLDAQFAASRGWLLTGGALAALTLGLLYVAAKAQAHAAALHIEASQLQAELAAMKALAAKTQQLAVTEGQARSEAISSRIAQLQSELAIAKAASAKSAAALPELRQETVKLSGAVAAIPQSLEPKFKAVSDSTSKLSADLASISQRVAALDGERQKQASEIANLSGAVAAIPQSLEPKFKTASDAASKLTADLASISQRVAALDGERQKLAAEIAGLVKQIEAGKAADEALQKDLQALKEQRAGIQTAVTETAEKVRAAESRLAHTEKWSRFNNAAWFQHFNRRLKKEHTEILGAEWRRRLSLPMAPATLGYMASRACDIEARLEGRLATSIEDILLRSLVARAVKGKSVDVLEIGTLFATGAAIMFDALDGHYEDIHFTLLDPLEGYYHGAQADILTGQRVNEHVVRKNLERAGMSEDQYTLIKHLSTQPEAMELAARRKYDVLVIDGDHSYAGVKTDFENYASLVRVGGYIIFDDYNSPDWPDVKEYVDSELGDHPFVSPVGSSWRTSVFRVVKAPVKPGRSPSASRRKPAAEKASDSA